MTDLNGMNAIVIGAARTGRSAAWLLAARGARVRVLDQATGLERDPQWPQTVHLQSGDDRNADLDRVDLIVPSPGVSRFHPLLAGAVARGIPVWSEIELAARVLDAPIVAITGTNGKSTTTTLIGAMLRADGKRVFVGGNLGTPLAEAALDAQPYDAAVVEVSSFQLEWVDRFRARVAVFLNLTPDHQDRYASLEEYGAAKARLLDGQNAEDVAVLNRNDPWSWGLRHRARAMVVSFGREPIEFGTYVEGDDVVVWQGARALRYPFSLSPLRGEHNRENILAAVTAAAVWGASPEAIGAGLRATVPLPHRLQLVREVKGVRYFDDSKGTNTGAVEKSVQSFDGGVILLLGGYDKGGDFTSLAPLLRGRVARVICFGKAGPAIRRQLEPTLACVEAPDLASGVRWAAKVARPGQVVLLSPGCASFDEFRDYNERGDRFRELVEAL